MSLWEQWRPWLQRQQALIRELILMLVVALVVGVYFLENFSSRLQVEQRMQLQALAGQTARRATEALVTDDRISLNLITKETEALAPVAAIQIMDARGETVGARGPDSLAEGGQKVTVPVALPDGEVVGSLQLLGAPGAQRQGLETGFVLATLCLLLLWLAITVVQRRLQPGSDNAARLAEVSDEHDSPPQLGPAAGAGGSSLPARQHHGLVRAQLRVSIVNFDRLRDRYTRDALNQVLSDYRAMLDKVAGLYGGVVEQQVGEQARLTFSAEKNSWAAFNALCCGLLFLRLVRLSAPRRKARGALPLEFKALVSTDLAEAESWALCVAGVPGRLHVPEPQLGRCELDVKALYQPEKALTVSAADQQVRLQPVEQLAHRYQALLRNQAETLLSEEGGE